MKAGKDLRGGGQQKGQSQEGQARLKEGGGAGNAVAGGLRLGGRRRRSTAVPPAPSLDVQALQPLSPPHWPCLSLWGRSPQVFCPPPLQVKASKMKRENRLKAMKG